MSYISKKKSLKQMTSVSPKQTQKKKKGQMKPKVI